MKLEVREVGDVKYKSVKVARADTKGKILDLLDAVSYRLKDDKLDSFEKVQFVLVDYGDGKDTITLKHYMDLDDFMVVAASITSVSAVDYTEYKGSESDKYDTGYESRVLNIKSFPTYQDGKGAYTIKMSVGPGTPGDKGQVNPVKGAKTRDIAVHLGIPEAQRVFMSGINYFNAKLTAALIKNWELLYG